MKAFLLSTSLIASPLAFAGEGGTDLREQCRVMVSGGYLSLMNDLDLLKSHLQVSTESSFALKARKKLSLGELKALEAKNEAQKTPAADLDEELVGLRDRISTTEDALNEGDARRVTIKEQIAAKEKEFKRYHELLKPVFEITNAKIVSRGAYPIKLEYRHACGKYQQLCPLPKAQSEALIKLSKTLEDGVSCERYAQIR